MVGSITCSCMNDCLLASFPVRPHTWVIHYALPLQYHVQCKTCVQGRTGNEGKCLLGIILLHMVVQCTYMYSPSMENTIMSLAVTPSIVTEKFNVS